MASSSYWFAFEFQSGGAICELGTDLIEEAVKCPAFVSISFSSAGNGVPFIQIDIAFEGYINGLAREGQAGVDRDKIVFGFVFLDNETCAKDGV